MADHLSQELIHNQGEEVMHSQAQELIHIPAQELMDKLFENCMKGSWEQVVKTYKENPLARAAKITNSGETALHLAVSDGKTAIALQLIEEVSPTELKISNNAEDTPLHLAAAAGDLDVCECILKKSEKSFTDRNAAGETPIFLAVLRGKKELFIRLLQQNENESHLKRNDGDTILHVAIAGEFFRLAHIIATKYPNFVNSINTNGLTPLHILASKTNAFRSSTSLGFFDRVLYKCLVVDKPDEQEINIGELGKNATGENATRPSYPANYEACMNFFQIPIYIITEKLGNKKWVKDMGHWWKKISSSSRSQKNSSGDDVEIAKPDSLPGKKESREQVSSVPQGQKEDNSLYNEGRFYPPNYDIMVLFFKTVVKAILIVLGVGISRVKDMRKKKELHILVKLVMNELVEKTNYYKFYGNTGMQPVSRFGGQNEAFPEGIPGLEDLNMDSSERQTRTDQPSRSEPSKDQVDGSDQSMPVTYDTPILIAAKYGVSEIVEKILVKYPVAIQDLNSEGKNLVLLAVENRQPSIYHLLLDEKFKKESVFRHVDKKGNSALHLAANLGKHKPWLIPGSALQMQWEIKWYEYVRDTMPPNFFPLYNQAEESPNDVFVQTHESLIKDGSEWLTKTSESCSLVAALVATVAFTTSSTVPGGMKSDSGVPILGERPAFNAFAISALVALCFSITALVFFLSILTSRYQEKDFATDLPRKLLLGLTSLYASIASMLVSFCAGHLFILNPEFRFVAYPLYAALCFPITFFGIAQLSLYFDLISAIIRKVPQRSYRLFPH